jgi:hypothetical protein
MTHEQQKEPNALDALGCYEDILVEALKDVDFMDAMALIDKAIPHNNTIRAALTVLQKIASGDDWFDVEECPHETDVLMKWHCQYTGFKYEAGQYSTGSRNKLGISNQSLHGQATHWKHIDGAKHIQMLMERELIK